MINDYKNVENILKIWLKDHVQKANASGVVVGLSGGIDSSVSSVIAKKVFPENSLGIIMPCYSSENDKKDAIMIAEEFNIKYKVNNLNNLFECFKKTVNTEKDDIDLALANTKARMRMMTLYYYAAKNNYLVLGTGNWSELKVGYFTKYGDGGVDLELLGHLLKTEVKKLAEHLEIPKKIIDKKPSAGLWEAQTDEEEMGVSYQELDKYILTGKAEKEIEEKITTLVKSNSHKTNSIPAPQRNILLKP